jgi:hypothetical protein
MDWENPLRSIAATVDADVLKVLAGAHDAVTGNELARLAGRSYAQVYAVVGRMVGEGLVLCVRYGRTKTYRLNNDHVLAHGIRRILATPARIEAEIRQAVLGWDPAAETVALVGGAAHRRVSGDGEVDLLVIRSDSVGDRDIGWRRQIDDLVRMVEATSGNPVRITEMTRAELRTATGEARSAIGVERSEARIIVGIDLPHPAARPELR